MSQQQAPPAGPPYPPQTALLGGEPNTSVDVPVAAVFLVLYVIAAACHMTILQVNRRRKHKFLASGAMFGFCMARITANVMRIVWAYRLDNVSIAIAANVFVVAGVVILFVINGLFSQRIVRALHPQFGWHPAVKYFFRGLWILLACSFVLLIAFNVFIFFTLDTHMRSVARDMQLYGSSFLTFLSFLPVILVGAALLAPRKSPVENFGTGQISHKIMILLFSSTILTLGAAFRLGTTALPPRPIDNPAWYQSKACFYVFNFVIEIIVIYMYIFVRVDRRFWIPNGSKGPGDYNGTSNPAKLAEAGTTTSEETVYNSAPTPPEEMQDRQARSFAV